MFNDIYELKAQEYGISPLPKDATSTMAYVPYQSSAELYSSSVGLCNGTMFPELNKPFKAYGGYKNGKS